MRVTDDPVKAPFWRNILFFTDGTTRLSTEVWSTEEEAKRKADEWLASVRDDVLFDLEIRRIRSSAEFLHILQLPWSKP
jgi:hypothetical protein